MGENKCGRCGTTYEDFVQRDFCKKCVTHKDLDKLEQKKGKK